LGWQQRRAKPLKFKGVERNDDGEGRETESKSESRQTTDAWFNSVMDKRRWSR
jgi:hypothetical protein